MNRKQREALLWVLIHLIAWSIFVFSGLVIYLSGRMSTLYIIGCAGCLVWVGLMWFLPLSAWHRAKSKTLIDERDIIIARQSLLTGFIGVWLYFIALSIILWFAAGPDGSVPIGAFPALLYVGMGLFSIINCLATWFQYRKDSDATEGESK